LKARIIIIGAAATGIAAMVGHMDAQAKPRPDEGGVAAGPDVIVGALHNELSYGAVSSGGQTIMAYAIGTTSCNIGTQQLLWQQTTTIHPVIPQNMYRVKDGRIEQIGQSWIKHGFCALQGTLCGACIPAGGGCPPVLGIGCSDPYDASLNGGWQYLGPRSQVNATTGVFPYPFWSPSIPATIGRRVQVNATDLNPALNPGARWFVEGQYVHPQDAASGNGGNNASYREILVPGNFDGNGAYNIQLAGGTFQQQPAINAWKQVHPDVTLQTVTVDGSFRVGHRVVYNGDNTWTYMYSVFNLNSDRSGGSFSVPVPNGVTVTNVGFHDIDYHSNEVYDNTDWAVASPVGGGSVMWATTKDYSQDTNSNALRWGTMYSFWFTADTAPVAADATLGLFKPGTPTSVAIAMLGPSAPAFAVADINQDGSVDGDDLAIVLGQWGTCSGCAGDINDDGFVDGNDLAIILGGWAP